MDTTTTLAPRSLAQAEGKTVQVLSDQVTFKALAEDTGGVYSLFETVTIPGGGTPPHSQRYEEESFYVLEGHYTFRVGDRTVELGPGGYAFVPRETVHAFMNTGEAPARMLILVTPGGIHEQFFAEMGRLAISGGDAPSVEQIVALATRYGIEILPPAAS